MAYTLLNADFCSVVLDFLHSQQGETENLSRHPQVSVLGEN